MRCPTVSDLPAPPAGRRGWPWTQDTPPGAARRADGSAWPKITVVTPSFNQAAYLEETIRSVLLQGYPDLEYIVVDGGSDDGSVAILETYRPWLSYCVSEKDRGQPHAINKGFARATGVVFQWINSDDCLCPSALLNVAEAGGERAIVAGAVVNFGVGRADRTLANANLRWRTLIEREGGFEFQQPGIFLPMRVLAALGTKKIADERFQYVFDWKLILMCLAAARDEVVYLDAALSRFRLHPDSKTVSQAHRFLKEHETVYLRLAETDLDPGLSRTARRRHRRQIAQRRVDRAVAAGHRGLGRLAALLRAGLDTPYAFCTRYYWGALRRSFAAPK